MSDNKSSASGGIGFSGLLCIAFIVLKLCNVIDWSWWWVLSPIWIPLGLVATVFIPIGIYYLVKYIKDRNDVRNARKLGMTVWAYKRRKKNRNPDKPDVINFPPKSKWQERVEEMQKNKR